MLWSFGAPVVSSRSKFLPNKPVSLCAVQGAKIRFRFLLHRLHRRFQRRNRRELHRTKQNLQPAERKISPNPKLRAKRKRFRLMAAPNARNRLGSTRRCLDRRWLVPIATKRFWCSGKRNLLQLLNLQSKRPLNQRELLLQQRLSPSRSQKLNQSRSRQPSRRFLRGKNRRLLRRRNQVPA